MKGSHCLRIFQNRCAHQHRHGRTHKTISIHHKSAAVHKRDPRFIQNGIRLIICPQNFILQKQTLYRRQKMKYFIENCQRKRDKQKLFRFTGNDPDKIPRDLFFIFFRINRHQIDFQTCSIFFIKLTDGALQHRCRSFVSAVTGCRNGDHHFFHTFLPSVILYKHSEKHLSSPVHLSVRFL